VRRLGARWRAVAPSQTAEAARDAVSRAQAALSDDHRKGAERQLLGLLDELVPAIDSWAARAAGAVEERPLSAAAGIVGMWGELCDIDVERESMEELLIWHAAHADAALAAALSGCTSAAELADGVAASMAAAPLPRPDWWRRLARRAPSGLGDRGHLSVQRGSAIVLERPPPAEAEGVTSAAGDYSTNLGELVHGDRLTLRWPLPMPGQVAVLHAAAGEAAGEASLSVLLPEDPSEMLSRRAGEVVEVVGEVARVSEGPEHGLVVLWGPELLPPTWAHDAVRRGRLPPDVRPWLYRYRVS